MNFVSPLRDFEVEIDRFQNRIKTERTLFEMDSIHTHFFSKDIPVMEASMDLMEQKVHELNARYLEMKEERDQVIAENEELQEQLDMTNTSASLGMQKINEVKIEVQKLAEEVNKIDYATTTQEHELKTLSDHMCDLNSLKETVKEHNEEIATIKEDYTRMKTHLNVSVRAVVLKLFS